MNDVMQTRIASMLMGLVGAWLLVSPLFVPITGTALISVFIAGGLLVVAGAAQLIWENTLPSWVAGLAAVWLVVSTAIFSLSGAALWSQLAAAVATILLATWDGIEVDQVVHSHSHA